MSDQVFTTLINGIVAICVAIISGYTFRMNARLKRVQHQVENDHLNPDGSRINMRVESDERHSEITRSLKTINNKLDRNSGRLDKIENLVYHLPKWLVRKVQK